MKRKKTVKKAQLPLSFRPILWGLKWNSLDIQRDREDIIMSAINEGTIDQWRWIRKHYGDDTIRIILKRRLVSEFHPESIQLARVVFGIKPSNYARRSSHISRA
ncbi:hypothetical protein HYW94_02965 [Candidatus Uhrbacteria bacterium]|nr:hypothetical protein [Candidatus Uhrbacteria bacterium]